MGTLHDYLRDYAEQHPDWAERAAKLKDDFFAVVDDEVLTSPIPSSECTADHPGLAGPNMDIGQCSQCWMPMGVMRPDGESFGWHIDDCSLPLRHPGYCVPGGDGHTIPSGWKLRG